MKYIGRTKVGRAKTNPSTVLAIVRLPVELKNYAGKWAHIWKVDGDTILIRFSDSKEAEELPSVYFGVQQTVGSDVEERLRRLEMVVEELRNTIIYCEENNTINPSNKNSPGGIRTPVAGSKGRQD